MDQVEARFNRTNLSRRDFAEAHEYLLEFSSVSTTIARKSIVVAAIIAYARPFKYNNGGQTGHATNRLEVDLESLLSPGELELHRHVVDLRDRAIAHSDYDFRPTVRAEGGVAACSETFITLTIAFDVLEIEPEVQRFTVLAKKLERYCFDELFRLNQELAARQAKQPA